MFCQLVTIPHSPSSVSTQLISTMNRKKCETSLSEREIIVKLFKEGKSERKIGTIIGRSRSTIQYILKKFKEENMIINKARSGRPRKLTSREETSIVRAVKKNPQISGPELRENVQSASGKVVSVDTVQRVLHRASFKSRKSRRKPWINATNRKKRLQFAKKYVSKPEEFWKRVIFTDETKICVFDAPRRNVWRRPNTAYQKENLTPTVKHGGASLMVWGSMSATGVGEYHFIEGIMGQWMYLNILKEHLLVSAEKLGIRNNFIFQQDNDPKHTARIVQEWILYNTPHYLRTPPQSPDINPIENLWSEIKKKIQKRPPKNKEELKERFKEEWQTISVNFTEKLIKSMPRRLEAIIRSNGYPTKY